MITGLIPNYAIVTLMSFAIVGKLSNKLAVQRWLAESRLLSRLPDYGFSVTVAYQTLATAAIAIAPPFGAALTALMVASRQVLAPRASCRCVGIILPKKASRSLDLLVLVLSGLVIGIRSDGVFGISAFAVSVAAGGLLFALVSLCLQLNSVHRNVGVVYG